MHPDLFSLGPLHVKTYGACMALGFLAAWQVVAWACKRTGRSMDKISNLLVALMVSGVAGSRIAYVVEHWSAEFAASPLKVVRVDQGGLMFYGGLILALVTFLFWCRIKKEPVLPLADVLAIVIPLGHAFGRIGCFFYGCCYGRLSECALAVRFPRGSPAWYEQLNAGMIDSSAPAALAVLPTQLFEAAACLAIFAGLFSWYAKRTATPRAECGGQFAGAYFMAYAVVRFAMEFLRGDPRAAVGPFSISQTISMTLFAIGVALVAWSRRKTASSN